MSTVSVNEPVHVGVDPVRVRRRVAPGVASPATMEWRRRIDGRFEGHEVRLAVALARVLAGAEVLVDDLRERWMELVRADLEGVAVAAGGVVGPVVGGAGGVVELPAVDVGVAVVGGHVGAQRLHGRFVGSVTDRVAVGADGLRVHAVRAQQQVRERVVADRHGDVAPADELAHVLGLGLGEAFGAVVDRRDRLGIRTRPAEEGAVVAVQVDAHAVAAG